MKEDSNAIYCYQKRGLLARPVTDYQELDNALSQLQLDKKKAQRKNTSLSNTLASCKKETRQTNDRN